MHQMFEKTARASNGHRRVRSTNVVLRRARVWAMAFLGVGLAACGGGGGGGGSNPPTFVAAASDSFSPTTAKDKATKSKDVVLHWHYAVNNGGAISSTLQGVNVSVSITSAEMTIDPADLKRRVALSGPLSGSALGRIFSGNYTAQISEELKSDGKNTFIKNQSLALAFDVSGARQFTVVNVAANTHDISPDYEWPLDSTDLDQQNIGESATADSKGVADFKVTVTDTPPVVRTSVPVSLKDVWTVVEKLPTFEVRGKTYNNVVKVTRETNLPDLTGNLTPVTMTYWVAKGIGMVKGQGVFGVLDVKDVIYELTDTNLSQ